MTASAPPPETAVPAHPSRGETVAMLAMLTATVAFSIDAMLPALPAIAGHLSPAEPNRAQLVLSVFMIGLGIGTLAAGPISDAVGRKRVAIGGGVLYVAGALLGAMAPSLELLLAARVLQGLGAAGPRVAALAIVRDEYSGRQMARTVSFIMTIFTLVPVFAPSIGAAIAWGAGWRGIFFAFAVFSLISLTWLGFRQPETLTPERRRPFHARRLAQGFREILTHRQVMLAVGAQTLVYSILFAMLISAPQIFADTFGRAASFPYWFGFIALVSAPANLLNAAIVVRLGMKTVLRFALAAIAGVSALFLALLLTGALQGDLLFAAFVIWSIAVFYIPGLGIGNLNAVAMEPVGHIAGLATSIITSTATVAGSALAVPIGQAFDGTPVPAAAGVLIAALAALALASMLHETGPD